ncbi:MAG: NAAT family transporter [Verrucomicrobia bacterium]|nr:NAAT family transporter [Verrucomicrobiota bacterium]
MFSIAFALFLLMDPVGNIPVFIAVLKDTPPKRHTKVIVRELLIALAIILLFQWIGDALLDFLNVSMPTILISGGIILFIIAIKMIFPVGKNGDHKEDMGREPFIVPLAIPLIAGPATLAAVMIYAGQEVDNWVVSSAVVIAWVASTLILMTSNLWKKLLGSRGLVACERLMGLILTLLAVQMFLEGLHLFLHLPA